MYKLFIFLELFRADFTRNIYPDHYALKLILTFVIFSQWCEVRGDTKRKITHKSNYIKFYNKMRVITSDYTVLLCTHCDPVIRKL